LSLGQNTVAEIWRQAKEKGLSCNKSNFWIVIKNPVYIGKIVIPKLKNEESYTVDGLHEAIIKPSVFYAVQDVLAGRKQRTKAKIVTHDMLALKGFITCPRCGESVNRQRIQRQETVLSLLPLQFCLRLPQTCGGLQLDVHRALTGLCFGQHGGRPV